MTSIDGLITGLNTTQIVSQLMQIERMPQTRLLQRKADAQKIETELRGMRTDVLNLRSLAADLRMSTGWNKLSATSSSDSVLVSAASGTTAGSMSFQVNQTAAANVIYSNETVASLNDVVSGSGSIFSASGTEALGFTNLSGTGFPDGAIAFEVTQSSAAATLSGSTPTTPANVTLLNQSLSVDIDGTSYNLSLANGTYNDSASLAQAVNDALTAAGANTQATVSVGTGGELVFTSDAEGSANSITITGGTAAATLGFTAGATATGVDGIVSVEGVTTAITDTAAAGPVTLNGANGSITADLTGGIRVGTADVEQVGTGGGTLQEVVDAINGAGGLNYTAMAVNTGSGYRLQLTAKESGAGSAINADTSQYNAFSGFTTLTTGRDAIIEVQGDNPYTITSSDNTFDNLFPGVDVTVTKPTTDPVTVTVGQDNEAQADSVEALVKAINDFFARADKATSANPGGEPGMLFGNSAVRRTRDSLLRAVSGGVGASALGSAGLAGITVTRDGTLEFDRAKFTSATTDDRAEVQRLFTAPDGVGEPGILDRIVNAAEAATTSGSGVLWSEAEATKNRIERWGEQIDAFEVRFERRETNLRRQYAALEVALGGLNEQSNYLASQLSSLPTYQ